MKSNESVEIAIRGAIIAKSALELLNVRDSTKLARLNFIEIVKGVKELDDLITRLEKGGN